MRAQPNSSARPAGGLLVAALLVAGAAATPEARAAEYFVDPAFRLSTQYESNPRLRDRDERDTGGAVLDVGAEFGARSPVSLVSIRPRFQVFRYKEDTLDRTDRMVDLKLERSLSETIKAEIGGRASRLSTLVSEAEDSGITGRRDRDRFAVSPSLNWQVGVRDRIELGFSYDETTYNEEEGVELIDYDFRIASLTWSRKWTDTTEGYGEVFGSEYRNLIADCPTESLGGRLGLNVKLSPTFTLGGSAGYVRSDSEVTSRDFQLPEGDGLGAVRRSECRSLPDGAVNVSAPVVETSENDSILASVKLQHKVSDISAISTGYDRSVAATGRGIQTIRDRLSVTWNQGLSDRVRFSLGASYQTSESDLETGRVRGRTQDTTLVSSEIRYQLSEETFIGVGYRYRQRDQDEGLAAEEGRSAENHTALIFFDYDLKPRTLLR